MAATNSDISAQNSDVGRDALVAILGDDLELISVSASITSLLGWQSDDLRASTALSPMFDGEARALARSSMRTAIEAGVEARFATKTLKKKRGSQLVERRAYPGARSSSPFASTLRPTTARSFCPTPASASQPARSKTFSAHSCRLERALRVATKGSTFTVRFPREPKGVGP